MKIKRQKRVSRFLSFFANHFGFHEPYQVLVDGTFCQAAIKAQVKVRDQITAYLGGHVKLLTTCCAVTETEKLGNLLRGAGEILKQFPVHKCGHEKQPRSGFSCFMDMVSNNNPNRYMIATQDEGMRSKLRKRVAIPLLYVHHRGPLLEKPSYTNNQKAEEFLQTRLRPSDHQAVILNELKEKIIGDDEQTVIRRRKRLMGPNPLSCKKKKVKKQKKDSESKKVKPGRRSKRRRIRIADHVKEHLANSNKKHSSIPPSSSL